jgi:hypothetical protein
MNEKIISLELAKLAAEKKINFYSDKSFYKVLEIDARANDVDSFVHKEGEIFYAVIPSSYEKCEELCYAYSQHDLQVFLREKHKIHITIHYLDDVYGYYSICTALANNMEFSDSGSCKTYEDALEMGLKAAVESLGRSKQFVGPEVTSKEVDGNLHDDKAKIFEIKLQSVDPTGIVTKEESLQMEILRNGVSMRCERFMVYIGDCLYRIDSNGFILDSLPHDKEKLFDKPYFVAIPMREIDDRLNLIKNQMKILEQGQNPTYVYALSCQYSLLVELRDLNKKIIL